MKLTCFLLFDESLNQNEEPIKRILLTEVKACRHESADARLPARFPFYFSVETDGRVFVISARNETERNEWVDAISKLLGSSNQKPVKYPPFSFPSPLSHANQTTHIYSLCCYTFFDWLRQCLDRNPEGPRNSFDQRQTCRSSSAAICMTPPLLFPLLAMKGI